MESLLASLYSAAILSALALGVSFLVYRHSRMKGSLPGRSFCALYLLLLLLGAWVCTTWLRPEPPFANEYFWFPLTGLFVIAAAAWVVFALSRQAVQQGTLTAARDGSSPSRRWGLPLPAGIYWAVPAALAAAALLGHRK